jgi:hypothetical protein
MKKLLLAGLAPLVLAAVVSAAPPGWSDYKSPTGHYQVALPGASAETQTTIPSPLGPLPMKLVQSMSFADSTAYQVGYIDYPDSILLLGDPSNLLNGAVSGLALGAGGKVLQDNSVTVNGHAGRDFKVSVFNDNGVAQGRVILVGSRLYVILAMAPKDSANPTTIKQFIDSFQLTDQTAALNAPPALPWSGVPAGHP